MAFLAAIPSAYLAVGGMAASAALSTAAAKRQAQTANARQAAQNKLMTNQYELSRNDLSERISQLNVDTTRAVLDLQQKSGAARGSVAAMSGASGQRGQTMMDIKQTLRQQESEQLDGIQRQSEAARTNLLKEGTANYHSLEKNTDYNYQSYNQTSEFAKAFAMKALTNLGSLGGADWGGGSTPPVTNTSAFGPTGGSTALNVGSFSYSQTPGTNTAFGLGGGLRFD